jgi:hypothetical protein
MVRKAFFNDADTSLGHLFALTGAARTLHLEHPSHKVIDQELFQTFLGTCLETIIHTGKTRTNQTLKAESKCFAQPSKDTTIHIFF